jgi:hypothetical protein
VPQLVQKSAPGVISSPQTGHRSEPPVIRSGEATLVGGVDGIEGGVGGATSNCGGETVAGGGEAEGG